MIGQASLFGISSYIRVCGLTCVMGFASLVFSQSADQVHITPRRQPTPDLPKIAAPVNADPALTLRTRPMSVNVNLVLVPVTVTDSMNRPILQLQRKDFAVYEGGVQQQVQYFSLEDSPLSVALVLDVSASMKNKIEYERKAVEEFFNNANPQDEYFAITVSDRPRLVGSSDSIETIQGELATETPQGKTALFDAIYLAVNRLRSARYKRRALLILSDGGDNVSRYTRNEIKKVIEEADVLTYSIGIFDTDPIPLVRTFEERMGRMWLSQLTDASGGRTIPADYRENIPEIAAIISRELRSQYVLGYHPSNDAKDGKWRKIQVRLAQPNGAETPHLQVSYKKGYIAPLP